MSDTNAVAPPVGLGHASMTVANLEASCRFYAALGLRAIDQGRGMGIFELRGGTHLLLFQKGVADAFQSTGSPLDQPAAASLDLMIAGRTRGALAAYRDRLVDEGLAPEPLFERQFFGHCVFQVRDPDGALVTISTSHASELPI